MGFPPASKNSTGTASQPAPTKDIFSKGSGGIPASLKVKNAAVKPAAFPRRVADPMAGDDKTQSTF